VSKHSFSYRKNFFPTIFCGQLSICTPTEKNGFVTATKLGTTNKFFVAATKNFAAATKRFVHRTKHFVVVTKYFCYPYFNKRFCWYNKTFFSVINKGYLNARITNLKYFE